MKIKTLKDLEMIEQQGLKLIYPKKTKISVGMATCGLATGAKEVYNAIEETVRKKNLDVLLTKSGCLGFCQKEPIMDISIPGIPRLTYMEMDPNKAVGIVNAISQGEIKKDYLLCRFEEEEILIDGITKKYDLTKPNGDLKDIPTYQDVPFFSKQKKIVLRNCGFINPDSIEEYIARGGYKSLYKVLTTLSPDDVIGEIKKSGLRGRGGAGFPTGVKWEFCRKAKGSPKYIVCNADEGDPGAYMDRSVLEGDPHSVLEGMLIGAYAIGAIKGYIYVRTEYPLAIEKMRQAIEKAKEYGLLGKNIFNTNFSFDIEIREGSGAFVCGEETSLIASIEGRPPEPRQRPPFPAESGLWENPTNINNVETWANIPVIIARGADWFSQIGVEKSKGTKVFSLVGKVKNTGLVEVPMGIPLKEIIYDIGEGIPDGKRFKAVQTGGPSGGCIPSDLIDLPVDYERLKEVDSIMGSGGMIIVDEDTCIIDVVKFFLGFTRDESCGKCNSCREGSDALLEVLTRISDGKGEEGDIPFLKELAEAIKDASLCGLGQTLPNPVLSTLQHFRKEYEAHIKYKKCPAVVCKGIISSACQHNCPLGQNVPCYIGFIVQRKFEEGVKIARKENPFPSITGRVCHHPCESRCRAGEGGGDPIAIRSLERFITDYGLKHRIAAEQRSKQVRDEQIAVVGSGPAGLTCAYYLALEGYRVTIFENLPLPGGMLAVGIPEYRLPKDILRYEIENIKKLGVEIKTNTAVGRDIKISQLKNDYKAIFIATGAHRGLKLGIPNEEIDGVIDAVEFLRKVNLGEDVKIGERVIVIGGGNAAVDAARVVKRLGKDVKIFYRRTRTEMPADKEEVEQIFNEGIEIQFLTTPVKVISDSGKLTAIECIKMKLGDIDKTGRKRPIPIWGSEFTVEVDILMPAIGQEPDISLLTNGSGLKISKWNTIEVNPETLYTDEEGIFAGGDVVTGPKTVTEAMAHGKIAAQMIHKYIQGEKLERKYEVTRPALRVEPIELTEEEMEKLKRPKMLTLPVSQRAGNLKEVEIGFTEEQAISEAKRCLRCDLEDQEEENE